ncbi:MAG: hypothetical protein Q9159_002453 [Coniocarpon cinnabarinum]
MAIAEASELVRAAEQTTTRDGKDRYATDPLGKPDRAAIVLAPEQPQRRRRLRRPDGTRSHSAIKQSSEPMKARPTARPSNPTLLAGHWISHPWGCSRGEPWLAPRLRRPPAACAWYGVPESANFQPPPQCPAKYPPAKPRRPRRIPSLPRSFQRIFARTQPAARDDMAGELTVHAGGGKRLIPLVDDQCCDDAASGRRTASLHIGGVIECCLERTYVCAEDAPRYAVSYTLNGDGNEGLSPSKTNVTGPRD